MTALDDGADAATGLLEPLVDTIEKLPQVDRERWWSGFMIACNSMVERSIGAEMASMIANASAGLIEEKDFSASSRRCPMYWRVHENRCVRQRGHAGECFYLAPTSAISVNVDFVLPDDE
jgi:hypothetical protein